MHLENLLKKFPHISLATHENNEEILDFFSRTHLKNKDESLHYNRRPNFFALIEARGRESLVFTLREDEGQLQGVAVVTLRPGFINGELTTVGYLGDLRVSLNRKLIREWRKCFKEFIECSPLLEETQGCRYFQTALMDDNSDSRATLAANKIGGVHYEPILPYQMVNVIGSYPHLTTPKELPLSQAKAEDENELVVFLNKYSKDEAFGHEWGEELKHRFKYWQGYSIGNFLVAKDKSGAIQSAVSYYNPKKLKTMSLSAVPAPVKLLKPISTLMPYFHQLRVPKSNESLEVVYLERPISLNEKLRNQTIHWSIKKLIKENDCHMIAFTNWPQFDSRVALNGLISHTTEMTLYSVHALKDGVPQSNDIALADRPPTFDMAMV